MNNVSRRSFSWKSPPPNPTTTTLIPPHQRGNRGGVVRHCVGFPVTSFLFSVISKTPPYITTTATLLTLTLTASAFHICSSHPPSTLLHVYDLPLLRVGHTRLELSGACLKIDQLKAYKKRGRPNGGWRGDFQRSSIVDPKHLILTSCPQLPPSTLVMHSFLCHYLFIRSLCFAAKHQDRFLKSRVTEGAAAPPCRSSEAAASPGRWSKYQKQPSQS